MTKKKFKQAISNPDAMFFEMSFKDGTVIELSKEELAGTNEDINRGYYYLVDYDSYDDKEIRISDILDIVPLDDEDEDDWYDEDEDDWYDEDEDDWDDEDEDDWDDED